MLLDSLLDSLLEALEDELLTSLLASLEASEETDALELVSPQLTSEIAVTSVVSMKSFFSNDGINAPPCFFILSQSVLIVTPSRISRAKENPEQGTPGLAVWVKRYV